MVVVEVCDEQMVDARDAGVAHGGLDALSVAAIGGGPAGIDKQRCARRNNQQRGLAAFHVDGVDEQVLFRFGLCGSGLRDEEQRQRADGKQQNGKDAAESDGAGSGGDSHIPKSVLVGRLTGEAVRMLIWPAELLAGLRLLE